MNWVELQNLSLTKNKLNLAYSFLIQIVLSQPVIALSINPIKFF